MKFCQKCGKELEEDVEVCLGCGCEVQKTDNFMSTEMQKKRTNKKPKIKKLWIILGAAALLLGILVTILFVPHNLKMNDFKQTNVVSAIMQYGIPESIKSNEDGDVYLQYGDKHDFYGITPYGFTVYPEEDRVVFFFSSDDGDEVYRKINRYCDFEENLLNMYHKFSYENLIITTYDYDGSYVSIEIN